MDFGALTLENVRLDSNTDIQLVLFCFGDYLFTSLSPNDAIESLAS